MAPIKDRGDADMMVKLGSKVKYGNKSYEVGSIAWLDERYYFLYRKNDVLMIPAVTLEETMK